MYKNDFRLHSNFKYIAKLIGKISNLLSINLTSGGMTHLKMKLNILKIDVLKSRL